MSGKPDQGASACRRVFIVEDHPAFREGLVQIIQGEDDLEVCGEAGDAKVGFEEICRIEPDLVLLDITLPGKSGLELIKELRAQHYDVKVLVVSMHDEAIYANRVLRAGGDGYIMKQEDPQELVHAIRDVLDGHIYVSENVLATMSADGKKPAVKTEVRAIDHLSDSDLVLLELIGRGKNNREIARYLHLDLAKVASQSRAIQRALKLKHTNELIRYAVCWVENGAA